MRLSMDLATKKCTQANGSCHQRQCWARAHTLTITGPRITWLGEGSTWRQGSRRVIEAQRILQTSSSLAGPGQGVGRCSSSFPDLGVEEGGEVKTGMPGNGQRATGQVFKRTIWF